jgi:hypothetical protein
MEYLLHTYFFLSVLRELLPPFNKFSAFKRLQLVAFRALCTLHSVCGGGGGGGPHQSSTRKSRSLSSSCRREVARGEFMLYAAAARVLRCNNCIEHAVVLFKLLTLLLFENLSRRRGARATQVHAKDGDQAAVRTCKLSIIRCTIRCPHAWAS